MSFWRSKVLQSVVPWKTWMKGAGTSGPVWESGTVGYHRLPHSVENIMFLKQMRVWWYNYIIFRHAHIVISMPLQRKIKQIKGERQETKLRKKQNHGSYPPAIKSVNGTSPINGYTWKFYWENRENHQSFILHWDVTKGQKAWTPGSWGSSCWWLLWKIVLSSATWLDMLKGKYVYRYIYIYIYIYI